jgi:hypothetical protein
MSRWRWLALAALLCTAPPTEAQYQLPITIPFLGSGSGFPVYDAAVHVSTMVTAIQTLLIEANQLVDLMPLDGLVLPEDRPGEWLGLIIEFVCHPPSLDVYLSFSLADICGTLGRIYPPPESLPETSRALAEWQAKKLEQTRLSAWDAIRAQALIETMELDVETIGGLLGTLISAIGNLQGQQAAPQFTAQQLLQGLRAQVIQATYYRAQTSRIADEVTTIQALKKINRKVYEGWPGMSLAE